MSYKFSIVNDEDDIVMGYCHEAEILPLNDESYSVLTLQGFKLTEEVKERPAITLSNFRLNFLSKDGKCQGGYYFFSSKQIKVKPLEISEDRPIEIEGRFSQEPVPFAYEVWENLRENPNELGQWTNLSLEEKRAWLQVARLSCRRFSRTEDRKEQVIIINGELVHDVETFFIAVGEAINGPFGYFGACLNGLNDCLCGDFGLIPPVTLEWKSFDKSFRDELVNHAEFVFLLIKLLTKRGCRIHLEG